MLKILKNIPNIHKDLLILYEKRKIEKVEKLNCTIKKEQVVHIRNYNNNKPWVNTEESP